MATNKNKQYKFVFVSNFPEGSSGSVHEVVGEAENKIIVEDQILDLQDLAQECHVYPIKRLSKNKFEDKFILPGRGIKNEYFIPNVEHLPKWRDNSEDEMEILQSALSDVQSKIMENINLLLVDEKPIFTLKDMAEQHAKPDWQAVLKRAQKIRGVFKYEPTREESEKSLKQVIEDAKEFDLSKVKDFHLFCEQLAGKTCDLKTTLKNMEEKKEYDYINPQHYKQGGMELWEKQVAIWGEEAYITHCHITAMKYRMRAGLKPDQSIERDIEKAKWYETKAEELQLVVDNKRKHPVSEEKCVKKENN
jgi:hypothetical protein